MRKTFLIAGLIAAFLAADRASAAVMPFSASFSADLNVTETFTQQSFFEPGLTPPPDFSDTTTYSDHLSGYAQYLTPLTFVGLGYSTSDYVSPSFFFPPPYNALSNADYLVFGKDGLFDSYDFYGDSRNYHAALTGFSGFYEVDTLSFATDNSFTTTSDVRQFDISNLQVDYFDANGKSISAVPEPSTWAMMLIGFAGLSLRACRKARAA